MSATAAENRIPGATQCKVAQGAHLVNRYEVTVEEFGRFLRETKYSPSRAVPVSAYRKERDWCRWKKRTFGPDWFHPTFEQAKRHPAVCVSWWSVRAYVQWLSAKTGNRYRLLSEAEWEYVARGGTDTARYWGSENEQCRHANGADERFETRYPDYAAFFGFAACDDGHVHTSPVGSYTKNGFGLYDVLGNVDEIVAEARATATRAHFLAAARNSCSPNW